MSTQLQEPDHVYRGTHNRWQVTATWRDRGWEMDGKRCNTVLLRLLPASRCAQTNRTN